MKISTTINTAVVSLCIFGLTSCDKASEIVSKAKGLAGVSASGVGYEDVGITEQEGKRSDAAYDRYLTEWSKVPTILSRVTDEETAVKAHRELQLVKKEITQLLPNLIIVSNEVKKKVRLEQDPEGKTEEKDTPVWFILSKNQEEYAKRGESSLAELNIQIERITKLSADNPKILLVVQTSIDQLAAIEEGADLESGKNGIRAMPKDWLPSGVTPS